MAGNLSVTWASAGNPQFAPYFVAATGEGAARITQETRKRTRLSPEARQQQLVEIGARLFAERPFNDVWIEQVAQEAGVSRGLIYHYFPNKRDFYAAIVRHALRHSFELTAPDPSTPPDRWLADGIDKLLSYVEENADAFRAVYSSRNSLDEDVRNAIRDGREAQIERMFEFLSPGKPASLTLRVGIEAWIETLDALLLDWIDKRGVDRQSIVQLACGSLVGTVAAAMIADGRVAELAELRHLAPSAFGVI